MATELQGPGPPATSTVTNPAKSSGNTVVRGIMWLAGVLLVATAARFWLHDAFPYFADYSGDNYGRYWANRAVLLVHIVGGTIALFTGPFQVWSGFKARLRRLHRTLGYAYVGGIAISASSSFYLTFHTKPDFGLSLFVLAVAWCLSIGMALVAIRNRRIDAHREWMMRSYIITFSFASYRYLVGLSVFTGLGAAKNSSVLWLSWIVPMMLFELYTQRDRVAPLKRRTATATSADPAPHAWT